MDLPAESGGSSSRGDREQELRDWDASRSLGLRRQIRSSTLQWMVRPDLGLVVEIVPSASPGSARSTELVVERGCLCHRSIDDPLYPQRHPDWMANLGRSATQAWLYAGPPGFMRQDWRSAWLLLVPQWLGIRGHSM